MSTQLLLGGRIYCPTAPDATAMAIHDGIVVWVGEDRTGIALHPSATHIDLAGSFVAPAFVDTHVHLTATGLMLTGLNLSKANSLHNFLELLSAHASKQSTGIIWGTGWDESRWPENRMPTTAEIDSCAPGRLVYLSRVDEHCAAVSTALRKKIDSLPSAPGFSPEQPLTGEAHHLVRAIAIESLSPTQRHTARISALDSAAAHGIVEVHECGGPDIFGYNDFREVLALPHGVAVRGYWGEAVSSADAAHKLLADTGAQGLGGDLFVDGSIGSRTAFLHAPYCDTASKALGNCYLSTEVIAAHIRSCTLAKIQAGFHVIGEAAVHSVVEAFSAVAQELGGPAIAACGHRLEHLEMVTAEQAATLGRLGVLASMQPGFDALWGGQGKLYEQRLGRARAAGLNPFALLAAQGVSLSFGSDSPVTPLNPWSTIRAAVHHHTEGSAISPRAAFAASTRGAWRAGGVRDGLAGTLVPGAPASYTIWKIEQLTVTAPRDTVQRWSTDPRAGVPPLPVLDQDSSLPTCLKTVSAGETIYER
ncbi:MAG: amidohydrolase [Mycobacteriaceae bacterium]